MHISCCTFVLLKKQGGTFFKRLVVGKCDFDSWQRRHLSADFAGPNAASLAAARTWWPPYQSSELACCPELLLLNPNFYSVCWEKESIHCPAPVQNFSLPKKVGATEERFRWWIWVSWFSRGFCIYHRPGKFFFKARKVLQKEYLSVVVVYAFFFSVFAPQR